MPSPTLQRPADSTSVPRFLVTLADRHEHAARQAPLAGAAVERLADDVDRPSRSASGMTTTKFLAPPSACTRLPACVAALVDVPGDRRRADERHRADARMIADRLDDLAAAVHEVDDARRQAALLEQIDHQRAATAAPAPTA